MLTEHGGLEIHDSLLNYWPAVLYIKWSHGAKKKEIV